MAGRWTPRANAVPQVQAPRVQDAQTQRALDTLYSAVLDLQRRALVTGGNAAPVEVFTATTAGIVSASGGDPMHVLHADGTWSAVAIGVTSVAAGSTMVSVAPTTGDVVVDVVPANFTGIPAAGVVFAGTDNTIVKFSGTTVADSTISDTGVLVTVANAIEVTGAATFDSTINVVGNATVGGDASTNAHAINGAVSITRSAASDVLYIQNTNTAGYSSVFVKDSSGVSRYAFGFANSAAADTTGRGKAYWSLFNSDFILTKGTSAPTTELMQVINSTGEVRVKNNLTVTSGNVGIGTNSPGTDLEVFGSDAELILHNSGQSRGGLRAMASQRVCFLSTAASDDLVFGYESTYKGALTEWMRLDNSTGRLGINTASPAYPLHVNGKIFAVSEIEVNNGVLTVDGSAAAVSVANSGRIRYTTTGQKFQVSANGGAYVDLTTGGGIGLLDGDKGDVTVSSSGAVWSLDNNTVTLAKMADIATASLLGRVTAGTGDPEVLTGTQATALLDAVTISAKGLVPIAPNDTSKWLRGDGTWASLPYFDSASTAPGVVPGSNGDVTKYLRGDGTWATPAGASTLVTANVIPKGDGTTQVASLLTDDGTTVTDAGDLAVTGITYANGGVVVAVGFVVNNADLNVNNGNAVFDGDVTLGSTSLDTIQVNGGFQFSASGSFTNNVNFGGIVTSSGTINQSGTANLTGPVNLGFGTVSPITFNGVIANGGLLTRRTLVTASTAAFALLSYTRKLVIKAVGGGGGGGGADGAAGTDSAGGGGGSGVYGEVQIGWDSGWTSIRNSTGGTSGTIAIVIGAAGSGGSGASPGAQGGTGGNTTVTYALNGGAGVTLTFRGGLGGYNGYQRTGTTITCSAPGGVQTGAVGGSPGNAFAGDCYLVTGQCGTMGVAGPGSMYGGNGGSSPLGIGASGIWNGNGLGAGGYGSGGGGASTDTGVDRTGGAGSAGAVIVEEYI